MNRQGAKNAKGRQGFSGFVWLMAALAFLAPWRFIVIPS